jgi:hypothetical protein
MKIPKEIKQVHLQHMLEAFGFTKGTQKLKSTVDRQQADEESKKLDFSGSLVSTAP